MDKINMEPMQEVVWTHVYLENKVRVWHSSAQPSLFILFFCCSICPHCRTHQPQWPPRRYNIPTFTQSGLLILCRPASRSAGNCHVWRSFTRPKNKNLIQLFFNEFPLFSYLYTPNYNDVSSALRRLNDCFSHSLRRLSNCVSVSIMGERNNYYMLNTV